MLEFQPVQQRGFHNTCDAEGNIDGFEFDFATPYYKGLWLTQCRFGNVIVDGETFDRDELVFVYNGFDYSRQELFDKEIYWQFREPITVRVRKPGGLALGYHDVTFQFGWVLNYNGAPEKEYDGSGLGNAGFMFGTDFSRRMLLAR